MVKLTGKRRYRADQEGKIILQVQTRRHFRTALSSLPVPDEEPTWRDATVEDLTEHEDGSIDMYPDCTRPRG
ncbi:hypothetical protein [Ochrobactrum sp. EDr1-4]|uniref:hypothetical protein n=1 Tax=Ochrobactrum sp. EDr1-4 TaxID=3368622 RepID=UPI003BA0E950